MNQQIKFHKIFYDKVYCKKILRRKSNINFENQTISSSRFSIEYNRTHFFFLIDSNKKIILSICDKCE